MMLTIKQVREELGDVEADWLCDQAQALPIIDDCVDNFRLADALNDNQMAEFEEAEREGCCGSATFKFEGSPSGRTYMYGFNYGH